MVDKKPFSTVQAMSEDEQSGRYNGRMPVVWRCIVGDSRHRPRGRPVSEGCGKYNLIMTSKRTGSAKNRWMGKCQHCGRKRSLNAGIVTPFLWKDDAIKYVKGMNGEEKVFDHTPVVMN